MNNFRFNHIQLGLTYAQANGLTKAKIKKYLEEWYFNNGSVITKVVRYLIAEEHHGDGGVHFHVYVRLDNVLRTRETRIFDIFDQETNNLFHPHVEKIRGLQNMLDYCTKEDELPVSNWDWKNANSLIIKKGQVDWDDVFGSDYSTAEEFLDLMMARYPSYFAAHYLALRQIAYDRYQKDIREYNPGFIQFNNLPPVLLHWIDHSLLLTGIERPKSLVLIGPSRTGKTEWARSIGRHMYFNNYFNLDLWDDEAAYAIFDDMDVDPDVGLEKYFRSWKAFFGAQKEFTVTDKYRRKKRVSWGKPIIWIANNEIKCNTRTMDYIRANSVICRIYNNLY